MSQYADPKMLVDTAWVVAHRSDPNVRVVEVDVDTGGYDQGHIPGAIAWNWTTQLCDTLQRDIIPPGDFQRLMEEAGNANDTTAVLYGGNNNWFAARALWQMKNYRPPGVRPMGGRGRK